MAHLVRFGRLDLELQESDLLPLLLLKGWVALRLPSLCVCVPLQLEHTLLQVLLFPF